MWTKDLIHNTLIALLLQVLLTWFILGVFFGHDMWQALLESLVTQILTTILGIAFLMMMFNKK